MLEEISVKELVFMEIYRLKAILLIMNFFSQLLFKKSVPVFNYL